MALDVSRVVLERLDAEERGAEDDRCREKSHQSPPVACLRRVDGERHRQTARDQHRGIGRAGPDEKLVTGSRERLGIPGTINRVRREEHAEEQHLSPEKEPHAQRGGFTLLFEVVELVSQRGRVVDLDGGVRQHGSPRGRDIRTLPR